MLDKPSRSPSVPGHLGMLPAATHGADHRAPGLGGVPDSQSGGPKASGTGVCFSKAMSPESRFSNWELRPAKRGRESKIYNSDSDVVHDGGGQGVHQG